MAGFDGLLDFVGYPVGAEPPPPPAGAGFVGLMDFVGYPVGAVPGAPPAPVAASVQPLFLSDVGKMMMR